VLLIDPANGGQAQPPGICYICEHHLNEHYRLIDTGRSYHYSDDIHDLITHLHGVKYICEHCAISAASVVMGTDLRQLANELLQLQAQVDEANQRVAEVEGMDQAVVDQVQRVLEKRTFARPGPKPGSKRTPKVAEA
jgi:hypothetical protein